MSLDTPWQIEQTWGSHQAVLKAVLKVLKPQTAIECGSGYFSTPLLLEYVQNLITIEHNQSWANKIQKDHPVNSKHTWIVQSFPNVKNWTSIEEVKPAHRKLLKILYEKLAKDLSPCDFLFMDTFRAARVPATKQLLSKANMLLLHDVEGPSYDYYQFNEIQEILKGWFRYEHRPDNIRINKKHMVPWTALYTRERIDLEKVNEEVIIESKRLWNEPIIMKEIHGA
ncbi:MAG: hypothetical protein ACTSO3_01225 [Candidatus Heimdallarchaeaceae archaeon]